MTPLAPAFTTGAEHVVEKALTSHETPLHSTEVRQEEFSSAMARATREAATEHRKNTLAAPRLSPEDRERSAARTASHQTSGRQEHAAISLRRASLAQPKERAAGQGGPQARSKPVSSPDSAQITSPQAKTIPAPLQPAKSDGNSDLADDGDAGQDGSRGSTTADDSDTQKQPGPQADANQNSDPSAALMLCASSALPPADVPVGTAGGISQITTQAPPAGGPLIPSQIPPPPANNDGGSNGDSTPTDLAATTTAVANEAKHAADLVKKLAPSDSIPKETAAPPGKPDGQTLPVSEKSKGATRPNGQLVPPNPAFSDGTAVATPEMQMKSSSEQNEFAQLAAQKESADDSSLSAATGAGSASPRGGASLASDFTFDKPLQIFPPYASSVAAPSFNLAHAEHIDGAVAASDLPARIEQIQNLVSREIVTVRQSGADSLAVSLKVDSHTDLMLQLTNHNGQIEASIRCERGDLSSLTGHWAQLQDSLARQNVHLLPLEDRTNSAMSMTTGNGEDAGHQKPFRNGSAPLEGSEETSSSRSPLGGTAIAKTQTKKSQRTGWESWA